ncbi:hypothetical protein APV57_01185 [Staphylococcus aureus]|nr:hypothetical protein APV57_01185 [Staphylococcus aureus]
MYFVIDNTLAHIYKFKHTDFNYLPNHVLCIREYTEDKRKIPMIIITIVSNISFLKSITTYQKAHVVIL